MSNLFFVDEDGFVFLTDAGMGAPVKEVMMSMAAQDILISRSSVWRLQSGMTQCFQPDYHVPGPSLSSESLGFVELTDEDRSLRPSMTWKDIARGFGISPGTAKRFFERGWFEVNASNEACVRLAVDPERILPPDVF